MRLADAKHGLPDPTLVAHCDSSSVLVDMLLQSDYVTLNRMGGLEPLRQWGLLKLLPIALDLPPAAAVTGGMLATRRAMLAAIAYAGLCGRSAMAADSAAGISSVAPPAAFRVPARADRKVRSTGRAHGHQAGLIRVPVRHASSGQPLKARKSPRHPLRRPGSRNR